VGRLIRASEVGDYVYCHRAWWLRVVEGRMPARRERLERGTIRHSRHGMRVRASQLLLLCGLALLVLAGALAVLRV
jgi:hypothetical protein